MKFIIIDTKTFFNQLLEQQKQENGRADFLP